MSTAFSWFGPIDRPPIQLAVEVLCKIWNRVRDVVFIVRELPLVLEKSVADVSDSRSCCIVNR